MTTSADNPLGLNGFEFVEFTSPDPEAMAAQFEALGFTATHRHPTKNITRYKQGRINLMLNRDDAGRVAAFRGVHGPSASAMATSSVQLSKRPRAIQPPRLPVRSDSQPKKMLETLAAVAPAKAQ